jgi:hypothetical protein
MHNEKGLHWEAHGQPLSILGQENLLGNFLLG